MPDRTRVITLLTDFGLRDYFVPAMKGVILEINPAVTFVDISHLIPPQDIKTGAFVLGHSYHYFPTGTIHMAVVDPGVGTARKVLVASAGGHYFVAPDNGILSFVLEREPEATAYEVTADHYFRKPVCSTFHGRDVFAPVAAWISRDHSPSQFGPVLERPVRFPIPQVQKVKDNLLQAAILAIDQFGNLVTNLKAKDLPIYSAPGTRSCKILAGQKEITSFKRTYAEGGAGELFVVPGSAEYLEIVMRNGSAASALNLAPGAPIGVVLL